MRTTSAPDPALDAETPDADTTDTDVAPVAQAGEAQAKGLAVDPGTLERSAPLEPFPGVRIDLADRRIELDAVVVLDAGWLEQIACAEGTREHEALVVPVASASHVHAALLAAGYTPGRPGRWRLEGEGPTATVVLDEPEGDPLAVRVRWTGDDGRARDEPIAYWIRSQSGPPFPEAPFVFGGSVVFSQSDEPDAPRIYAADQSGSIIGLTTFGDETIGYSEVVSPEEGIAAPEWEAWTEHLPPPGTPCVVVLEPWGE